MNKTFKDFTDNLLPGTICRYQGLRYHYVGSVMNGNLEVFIFKHWNSISRVYKYTAEPYDAIKQLFESGQIRIERRR